MRGINEDDYNNNDWILAEIEKFQPDCLILGNTPYTHYEYLRHGSKKFLYPPLFESINSSQTFATNQIRKFLEDDMETNLGFYPDEGCDSTIFQLDYRLKRKIVVPELTLCKNLKEKFDMKFFYGAPNPLFIDEDIALTYSLEELKHFFYKNLDYLESLIDQYDIPVA